MNQAVEATEPPFTDAEKRTLSIFADMIVPASDEFGVPGAGDAAIVGFILADAARRPAGLSAALSSLEELARETHDVGFAELSAVQRDGVAEAFRETRAAAADLIAALTVQAYYRDDRVMLSLGMEPRPPHPDGYAVEQGDWSLLDPVRKWAEFYRKTE
jgi:hypothetical protein